MGLGRVTARQCDSGDGRAGGVKARRAESRRAIVEGGVVMIDGVERW
jgi:hypothetical protein